MKRYLFQAALLIWTSPIALAGAQHATATDSEPSPRVLALSHDGKSVVLAVHGENLELADTKSGHTMRLDAPGEGIVHAAWGADDSTLIVVRGSTLSLFSNQSAQPVRVVASDVPLSDVEVSPNGRYVSVIAKHRLQMLDLSGGQLRPVTSADNTSADTSAILEGVADPVYAAMFNVSRHYWWSADSRTIAYIETTLAESERAPIPGAPLPAFALKLVDVHSGAVTKIVESDETWPYLFRVSWSADGRQLLYYRMNRSQVVAELRLFDGTDSKTLFRESDPYWVSIPSTPRFLVDGHHIIVTSGRSGANHVFRYDIPRGKFEDVTAGDCNIYDLLPNADTQDRLYATGTVGDKQNKHLIEIDLWRGSFRQLTTEPGWHDPVVADRGVGFVDLHSSAKIPPKVVWHPAAGVSRELVHSQRAMVVQEEAVQFKMHDGAMIPARWFKPVSFASRRKYPTIVYASSGPNGSAAQNRWGGWQMAWNRSMVEHGYLVLALDTRGTEGYGHPFEEYIHTRLGAQEIGDIREVLNELRKQAFVDSDRIGIWGTGYGGYIAVEALLDIRQGFKAGFADSPIVDWSTYPAYFSERYLGLPATSAFSYFDSSATRNVRRIGGTLMLTRRAPATVTDTAQIDAFDSAVARAAAKRPQLRAHFRVLNLDDRDKSVALSNGMTAFFDATL